MQKISFYIAFLNLLIISAISFGQTYDGPSTRSVDSGIVVTTDDFLSVLVSKEVSAEQRIINLMEYNSEPLYYDGDRAVFDNYIYVEDEAAQLQGDGEIGMNFELLSFPGNTHKVMDI